jgi:hypothetical protein
VLRPLFVCAVAILVPFALATAGPAGSKPAATQDTTPETVVHLTVDPMRPPWPALKYQLLPELQEMNPGNPVQGYLICFAEQHNFFFNKESGDNREKWQTMPLAQLVKEVRKDYGGSALHQADWAARLDTPDWQILLKARRDGINLLLPDIQQMRVLASALKVRFRLQVAEGRFDDAVASLKTQFAMARHLGEHTTLIGNLVGIAIGAITLTGIDEMVQQPGCPNLYWALTYLPAPLVGSDRGGQGERMWTYGEFALIDDQAPMTDEALEKAINKIRITLEQIYPTTDPRRKPKEWLQQLAGDKERLAAARARLVRAGLPADRVERFPPLQVVLVDEKLVYETERDDSLKAMQLPFWEGAPLMRRKLGRAQSKDGLFGQGLFAEYLPALYKVRQAQARLEQRIALLRCVEAIRLYAAEHHGKLPEKLTDLTVPVPIDPHTGRPFLYSVEGDTAKVQGTPPDKDASPVTKVRYEVTIRKERP